MVMMMMRDSSRSRRLDSLVVFLFVLSGAFVGGTVSGGAFAQAPAGPEGRPCRVIGRVASGDHLLPGVVITALVGDKAVAMTSTDGRGEYVVLLSPGQYQLRAELTAFARFEREVTLGAPPCELQVDAMLALASRTPGAPAPAVVAAQPPAAAPLADPAAGGGRGRGGQGGGFGPRFETLTVQQAEGGEAAMAADTGADAAILAGDDPAARLLPAGFSVEAPLESIAVNGTMVELDRSMLNDRVQALARGEFGLGEGEFGQPGQLAQGLGALPGIGGAG
jgi:hypothetical protein